MKIEVNITKRYFLGILGAVLLLIGVIGTFAYTASPGAVPNPGHALTSIQGYFSGDTNLQTSLGKFCQADGTNCVSSTVSCGWVEHPKGGDVRKCDATVTASVAAFNTQFSDANAACSCISPSNRDCTININNQKFFLAQVDVGGCGASSTGGCLNRVLYCKRS